MVLGGLSLLQTGVGGLKSLQRQTQTFTHPITPKISPKKHIPGSRSCCSAQGSGWRCGPRPGPPLGAGSNRTRGTATLQEPTGWNNVSQWKRSKWEPCRRKGKAWFTREREPRVPRSHQVFFNLTCRLLSLSPTHIWSAVGVGGSGGESYCWVIGGVLTGGWDKSALCKADHQPRVESVLSRSALHSLRCLVSWTPCQEQTLACLSLEMVPDPSGANEKHSLSHP